MAALAFAALHQPRQHERLLKPDIEICRNIGPTPQNLIGTGPFRFYQPALAMELT